MANWWWIRKRRRKSKAVLEGRSGYETLKTYTINDIIPLIVKNKNYKEKIRVNLEGYKVRIDSSRLQLFKKSLKCVKCGLEGSIFLLQRFKGEQRKGETPHLNLYGNRPSGQLILMTKDHIIPKSKGGKTHSGNLQTMCTICNWEKGNRYKDE